MRRSNNKLVLVYTNNWVFAPLGVMRALKEYVHFIRELTKRARNYSKKRYLH